MSLRDELRQMMRWEISGQPAIQEAYATGEYEKLVTLPPQEQFLLVLSLVNGLREAIFRLADEVDALKLDSG